MQENCLIIHIFCKSWEPEVVLVCIIAKKIHGRKSYKLRESKLLYIGNFEENINLSDIYLAMYNYLTVLLIYWTDFYAAIFEKQSKVYQSWKGYPVAVFWYIFGISKYIIINYGSLGIVNCIRFLLLPKALERLLGWI